MKAFLWTAIALLVCTATHGNAQSTDELVREIRAKYQAAEQVAHSFHCRDHSVANYSAEGGTLRICYSGARLRKITATWLGETGRAIEDFYFDEGEVPFFVLRHEERYTAPSSGRIDSVQADQFFFHGGHLFRWIASGGHEISAGTALQEKERELLDKVATFREFVRRP
jgi:hypothetical protein